MNKIKKLVRQKKWGELISNYSVKDVCLSLNFSECMHTVESLFCADIQDDEKRQYALKLCYEVKNYFKEWQNDWKNDVFLGHLCGMLWLYDERYLYYKSAYDKLKDPPQELLLLLSGCNSAPGTPPITDAESEFYLMQALEKKLTYEVAIKIRYLYRRDNNTSKEQYWDQMCKKLEKENVHSNQIIPDVLKE